MRNHSSRNVVQQASVTELTLLAEAVFAVVNLLHEHQQRPGSDLRVRWGRLANPFFAHGQCYVAFSGYINPENVKVLLNDENQRWIWNVVFFEVFNYLQSPVEV